MLIGIVTIKRILDQCCNYIGNQLKPLPLTITTPCARPCTAVSCRVVFALSPLLYSRARSIQPQLLRSCPLTPTFFLTNYHYPSTKLFLISYPPHTLHHHVCLSLQWAYTHPQNSIQIHDYDAVHWFHVEHLSCRQTKAAYNKGWEIKQMGDEDSGSDQGLENAMSYLEKQVSPGDSLTGYSHKGSGYEQGEGYPTQSLKEIEDAKAKAPKQYPKILVDPAAGPSNDAVDKRMKERPAAKSPSPRYRRGNYNPNMQGD